MPIRVPQIVAQTDPTLGPTPSINPNQLAQYTTAPLQGIATLAETIQKASQDYLKVQTALTNQDMKLDVEDKLTQVRDRLAQEDITLRQEGVNPDQLAEQFRQRGTQAISQVAQDLRYPQSAGMFQIEANKVLGHEVIKQRYEGLKLKYAHIGVLAGIQNQEDVNAAVFADDPAVRDAAMGRINGRIGQLTATGVWSQDKATTETEGILSQIELGRARRNFQNPDLRSGVLDQLLNGRLPHVKPEAQLNLAQTLQAQSNEEYKQTRAAIDKWLKDQEEAALLDLTIRANDKTLTMGELIQTTKDWGMKGTDFERVAKILAEKPAEPASDPATLDRVIADTEGAAPPRLSERALLDLHTTGKLNTADYRRALDKRTAADRHFTGEYKSDTERAYAQGKQRIKTALGIPDIMDRVDDPRMGAWSAALDEYDRRAAGARGSENPNKVSDDIVPRYQTLLGDRVNRAVESYTGLLKYNSMTELNAARPRPADYESQRRLLLERDSMQQVQNKADEAARQRKLEAEQKKAQSGILNTLRNLLPGGSTAPPANLR